MGRNYEAMSGKPMPETEEEADEMVAEEVENLKAEGKVNDIPETWNNTLRPRSAASRSSKVSAAGGELDDSEEDMDPMEVALELGLWGMDDDDSQDGDADDAEANVEQGGGFNILTDVIEFATELLGSVEEAAAHVEYDEEDNDQEEEDNDEIIDAQQTPNPAPGDA